MLAAALAFDPEAFAGGEDFTPRTPLRGDSFSAQQALGRGFRWLHVHPRYLVTERCWEIVRLAAGREDGLLPVAGGMQDQPAWTMAAIEVVRGAWGKLRAARDARRD